MKTQTHKNKVYQIGQQLIFAKGIRGWTMEDIAKQSGITKRTLYKIIPNKKKFIEQILIAHIQTVQKKIEQTINGSNDYLANIEEIIHEFPKYAMEIPSTTLNEIFLEYPSIENKVIQQRQELTQRIATYLQKGIDQGIIRPNISADMTIQMFQAMLLYFIKNHDDNEDFIKKIQISFTTILTGIKK